MNKPKPHQSEEKERLQKILARAGYGARREIETWIRAGRISINGETAELGVKVDTRDVIRIDGKVISLRAASVAKRKVIIYNKPEGEICSRADPEGRPSVYAHLPTLRGGKWISVGRLDFNTSGLLLFTNDGELANRLMHPSHQVEREYAVRVLGRASDAVLKRLRKGVVLEDGAARFDTISDGGGTGSNHWYYVTLREGRNREVRRLWESQDFKVTRLMRVRFGTIRMPKGLKRRQWRALSPEELTALAEQVDLEPKAEEPTRKSVPQRRRPPERKQRGPQRTRKL